MKGIFVCSVKADHSLALGTIMVDTSKSSRVDESFARQSVVSHRVSHENASTCFRLLLETDDSRETRMRKIKQDRIITSDS
jgi:hypothetical protein